MTANTSGAGNGGWFFQGKSFSVCMCMCLRILVLEPVLCVNVCQRPFL